MVSKLVRAIWVGATILVLAITLYAFDGKANSDIGIFFAWCMLILSFPGGLLVALAHVALFDGLSIAVETSYLSLVLDWVGFFALGYIQWFKLAPFLIAKLRALMNKGLGVKSCLLPRFCRRPPER